jgi:hypothetical protein
MAVDPTYPLYPITCLVCAALLLLLLATDFIRRSFNLGVFFLCFWLFVETLTKGLQAVVWADNAVVKTYVFCDIGKANVSSRIVAADDDFHSVTHLQVFFYVVKPACTLIITRRLYKIASLCSVEPLKRKEVWPGTNRITLYSRLKPFSETI